VENTERRPGIEGVRAAAGSLTEHLARTPLRRSAALERVVGTGVHLKLENRQHTGSFKVRGALNALLSLGGSGRERGVVTASAGNHGAGLAFAARQLGIRATVFVPAFAPAAKRERIAGAGAELRLVAGGYDAAHGEALSFATASGAIYIHAFSDPAVVEGQGTVGVEIVEALPAVATIVVPVGGGGLIGGVGLVARAMAPGARVIGVQTPVASAVQRSLAAGVLRPAPTGDTLCDGLEGDTDERSLDLARQVVDEVVLVEEDAVARAVGWLLREEGERVEPSGAVAVAALLQGAVTAPAGPVVAVVSGGNVDDALLRLLAAGRPASEVLATRATIGAGANS
jgi:threonine dehydratase